MLSPEKEGATDAIVVGGGIVGCATAYFLARKGASVRLLERGPVGGEQSSRAWGFIRQQGRHAAEVPVAALAARMWSTLETELGADLEYVPGGIVLSAETEDDELRLQDALKTAEQHDVGSRMLNAREIAELAPGCAKSWRSGLFTPSDAHAEPTLATRAFADAARRQGVKIHEFTPVISLETTNGAVSGVVTRKGTFGASIVICAGGIGTRDLSKSVGVTLPILPVRAPVAQTQRAAPEMKAAFWSPHVAFRPKRDGSFYIGNGYREIDAELDITLDAFRHLGVFLPTFLQNYSLVKLSIGRPFLTDLSRRQTREKRAEPLSEPDVNGKLIRATEREFYKAFPQFKSLGLARTWAGRIDATPDLIPIIDRVGPANYLVAAGFNGHGFTLSPAVARLLAEWVVDGKPSLDLTSFRLSRFSKKGEAFGRLFQSHAPRSPL